MALLDEREKTHGDFLETSCISQRLKGVWNTRVVDLSHAQQEALELICLKMARILAGNPNCIDHWTDIAGYAELGRRSCLE